MNKASGSDGILAELFQILKDDAVKLLHSIFQQIWKIQEWPQDWKRSVFIPITKKDNAKEFSNYHTIALISHASKVMSKFSKPGFNSTWILNFQMFKLDLEKAEEPEIKSPTSVGSQKKQENSRKTSTSASLNMLKPLTVWITTNSGKFLKKWEYQTTWPASWETCMQVKKQQLGPDMQQWTGSKLGKEYIKAIFCHFVYSISEYIVWNARLDKAQAGIKIARRNINNLRYAMRETWVWSLSWEDSLEKGKATHSSILAWRIPWSV